MRIAIKVCTLFMSLILQSQASATILEELEKIEQKMQPKLLKYGILEAPSSSFWKSIKGVFELRGHVPICDQTGTMLYLQQSYQSLKKTQKTLSLVQNFVSNPNEKNHRSVATFLYNFVFYIDVSLVGLERDLQIAKAILHMNTDGSDELFSNLESEKIFDHDFYEELVLALASRMRNIILKIRHPPHYFELETASSATYDTPH